MINIRFGLCLGLCVGASFFHNLAGEAVIAFVLLCGLDAIADKIPTQ